MSFRISLTCCPLNSVLTTNISCLNIDIHGTSEFRFIPAWLVSLIRLAGKVHFVNLRFYFTTQTFCLLLIILDSYTAFPPSVSAVLLDLYYP